MMCAHRFLDELDGSPCTREEHPDHPNAHVYKDGHGSDLNDVHGEAGHG